MWHMPRTHLVVDADPAYRGEMGAKVAEYFDVLIIGAGISGIGAAYRIHEKNPQLSYRVLERRGANRRHMGPQSLSRHPVRQRYLHVELSLRAVDPPGIRR